MQLTKETATSLITGLHTRTAEKEILPPSGVQFDERIALDQLIGRGSVGDVYKARQHGVERPVAVKTLHADRINDRDNVARFFREAKVISTLDHPGIVKIYAIGKGHNGQPYFVLDYINGKSLSECLADGEISSEQEFVEIFSQLLAALEHAHQRGVVHRDVKPANILIQRAGDKISAYLADFGIARFINREEQSITRDGAVVGSPVYMSPEQCLARPADGRSDLYSLACVMFEVLTGKPPFQGDNAQDLVRAHLADLVTLPPVKELRFKVSPYLRSLVQTCLEKQVEDRYQTAGDMLSDLQRVSAGHRTVQTPPGRKHKNAFPHARLLAAFASVIFGVAVVAATIAYFWHEKQESMVRAQMVDEGTSYVRRASTFRLLRRFNEAEELLARARARFSAAHYESRISSELAFEQAMLERKVHKVADAVAHFREAADILKRVEPGNKLFQAEIKQYMADLLIADHQPFEAIAVLEDADSGLCDFEDGYNEYTKKRVGILGRLATLYMDQGNFAGAARVFPKLIDAARAYGAPSDRLAVFERGYANALSKLGLGGPSRKQFSLAADYDRRARLE